MSSNNPYKNVISFLCLFSGAFILGATVHIIRPGHLIAMVLLCFGGFILGSNKKKEG
ncbi:hypothetical protein [Rummeliibacillus stabekisii]|uniref:hypothetical protein n=1 Tax=Rummeliibacillus stabekisii TaxID=241244 RepID=UPI00131480EA|nr:hypothetical protein [Rummeliibacillus stabekisii]